MRENDSQINFCSLESNVISATRLALKLLPGSLGLLFFLWFFLSPPLWLFFSCFLPFFPLKLGSEGKWKTRNKLFCILQNLYQAAIWFGANRVLFLEASLGFCWSTCCSGTAVAGAQSHHLLQQEAPSYTLKPTEFKLAMPRVFSKSWKWESNSSFVFSCCCYFKQLSWVYLKTLAFRYEEKCHHHSSDKITDTVLQDYV